MTPQFQFIADPGADETKFPGVFANGVLRSQHARFTPRCIQGVPIQTLNSQSHGLRVVGPFMVNLGSLQPIILPTMVVALGETAPVNLLGRDVLCKLTGAWFPTRDGAQMILENVML